MHTAKPIYDYRSNITCLRLAAYTSHFFVTAMAAISLKHIAFCHRSCIGDLFIFGMHCTQMCRKTQI